MKKSVDIENCLASSKLQKYFKKNWEDFFKIFENRRFLIIKKIFLKIADFQIFYKKSSQILL